MKFSDNIRQANLVVDAHIPRIAKDINQRPVVEVVVGMLVNEKDEYLFTTRPKGKVYEGYWEFPGGKIETGESADHALARELQEEIGITVTQAVFWRDLLVDYPHACVRLHFFRVSQWLGEIVMRERQSCVWSTLPPLVMPILPSMAPILVRGNLY